MRLYGLLLQTLGFMGWIALCGSDEPWPSYVVYSIGAVLGVSVGLLANSKEPKP